MKICTFFGHRTVYGHVELKLKQTISDLIINENVDQFYVGNNGEFDSRVYACLKKLKNTYTNIKIFVILAYLPRKKEKMYYFDESETIYPEGLESVMPKFAINRRNAWMLERSDYVVTYVKHGGNAEKLRDLALKRGKTVLEV